MISILRDRLWAYIVENNPELMFNLQEEYTVTRYLEEKVSTVMPMALKLLEEDKPGYAIQELCMDELTADLRPSRFHYICGILAEEFENHYERLRESGLLTYEAVNLVEHCHPAFEELHFSEVNERERAIHYAITGKVAEYLEAQVMKED